MINNSFTSKSLLILLWNANGLKNHRNELLITLQEKRIDIVLISETHFTNTSYINFPGYHTYRANHPDNSAHAGAAIYIRASLAYTPLPNFHTNHIQSCAVSLFLNNIPITIAAAYCPPRHRISPDQFTEFLSTLNNNYIVGGDLNAKHIQWGCRASNPRGNSLLQTAYHSNITILAPPNFTYWPTSLHKMPDILDIFVAKIPNSLHTQIQNLLDPCSDHSPVLLSIDCQPPDKLNSSMLSQYRTDWVKFGHILSEKTDLKLCLKTASNIDDAVNLLTNNIQSAVWESAIQTPPRKTEFNLPIHIRTLISLKRRARAIWQHSRYPSDKRHYNALTLKLKRLLANYRSETYANYASSLSHNDGSLWKASRKLLRIHNPPPTLRNDDGTWALSD